MQEWVNVLKKGETHTMNGYCWLHDLEYKLNEPDDVCPRCLDNKQCSLNDLDLEDEITIDEMEPYER